jgi:hypothetical protein
MGEGEGVVEEYGCGGLYHTHTAILLAIFVFGFSIYSTNPGVGLIS